MKAPLFRQKCGRFRIPQDRHELNEYMAELNRRNIQFMLQDHRKDNRVVSISVLEQVIVLPTQKPKGIPMPLPDKYRTPNDPCTYDIHGRVVPLSWQENRGYVVRNIRDGAQDSAPND